MEMFPAADEDAWTLVKQVIDASDYYIVIVGGRYGSTSEDGISFTEREYDYATTCGIPTLAFLHEDPDEIAVGKSDVDQALRSKLESFRQKARKKLVRTYRSPADLGSAVSRSLIKTMKQVPREGWVRGRHALTPAVSKEISDLKARVAELQLELATERGADALVDEEMISTLAQGSDPVEIHYSLDLFGTNNDQLSVTCTWDELFALLGPSLIDEATESAMIDLLKADLYRRANVSFSSGPHRRVSLAQSYFDRIKVQFRALDLIEKGKKKRGVADKSIYWKLTARGDRLLVSLIAERRA
jgi:hypothetical protein